MQTECRLWVKQRLAKEGTWGGTETIYAVAELEQVNILIFNEHGECYTLRNMTQYDRTLCIAYRLPRCDNGEIASGARFHYDSVCDIDLDVSKLHDSRST